MRKNKKKYEPMVYLILGMSGGRLADMYSILPPQWKEAILIGIIIGILLLFIKA